MHAIVLDAYAARSCPVKTFNVFDRALPQPERPDESLGEAFHGGLVFEAQMLDQIAATGNATDLRPLRKTATRAERREACLAAMARGDRLIIGGSLPVDIAGHRRGSADLLVRGPAAASGVPGYYPVEVKLQRVLERRATATGQRVSRLAEPYFESAVTLDGETLRVSKERTLLQLAHYWRILDATGHAAAGPARAGVIGIDDIGRFNANGVTWVELEAKQVRTFSRTAAEGWRLRSPLDRYDHEHRFRVHIATAAAMRTGHDDPPPPVVPIVVRECDHCVWWERCREQLDDESITLRINKAPLDVREISTLAKLGVQTVTELATADLEALLPDYLPEVAHRHGAESRLRLAAHRAQLLADGVELERVSTDPLPLPRAAFEIDFDIETSDAGRTYLWGVLMTDTTTGASQYRGFARFEDLSGRGERALFEEFAAFLVSLIEAKDALVYHYSDYEKVFITRLAKASSHPAVERLVELMDTRFVDLFAIMKENFFGAHGLGLKTVAAAGPNFEWRDDDPGGLNSQEWFNDAVHAAQQADRDAARERVLAYNEDDVLATKSLREWLTSQD